MNGQKQSSNTHNEKTSFQSNGNSYQLPELRSCLVLLLALLLYCPLFLSAQPKTTKAVANPFNTDIYIPLRDRDEVKVIPLLDTLLITREYLFIMRFSPKFTFSELFMDKGLAIRTDSFLTIIPRTTLTSGFDTATFRIIGFSNNNRILLFHRFLIQAQPKIFPTLNPAFNNVMVNNTVLERNMTYSKHNFPDKCTFGFEDNGPHAKDNVITTITLSLVNRSMSKNLFIKGNKPNDDMLHEIHKARPGTLVYIRLDIKNGRKSKSIWTRFVLAD